MKYKVNDVVKIKSKVGLITEIYDDVYLITFFDKDRVLQTKDYGYFLEEEVEIQNLFPPYYRKL